MRTAQRKEVIAALLKAKRPDLANHVARQTKADAASLQVAANAVEDLINELSRAFSTLEKELQRENYAKEAKLLDAKVVKHYSKVIDSWVDVIDTLPDIDIEERRRGFG